MANMSRKSFQTPQDRRSMLGYGKASAMMKSGKAPESKKLSFSANRSRNSAVPSSGVKRYALLKVRILLKYDTILKFFVCYGQM